MNERARKSKEICDEAFEFEPVAARMSGGQADIQKAISLYEKAIEIDSRNVDAYHCLARIYALELNDLEKAEYYCQKGYEVTDIPPEIKTPAIGVDDVRAEAADEFNDLMVIIRLKQGRSREVQEYLNKMKAFFDRYSKGHYHTALQTFNESQQQADSRHPNASTTSQSRGGGGCFSILLVLVGVAIASGFLLSKILSILQFTARKGDTGMAATIIGRVKSGSGKNYQVKWDSRNKDLYVSYGGWTKIGQASSARDAMNQAEAWLYNKQQILTSRQEGWEETHGVVAGDGGELWFLNRFRVSVGFGLSDGFRRPTPTAPELGRQQNRKGEL